MLENITMTGVGGSGGESLAVTLPQIVAFTVLNLALLFLFVLILWRWDVVHASRLPRAVQRRIDEFVRSVIIWDFEGAERAAAQVLWEPRRQDSA